MPEDPIVEEVRDARREIEKECDDDFQKIAARATEIQRKIHDADVESLKKTMDEIAENARKRGLTPEILESILADE